jgi:hypothetical protein
MIFQGSGFTLDMPSDWRVRALTEVQALISEPTPEAGIPASFAVALRPTKATVTLDAVVAKMQNELPESYAKFTMLEEGDRMLSGHPAYGFHYTWFNDDYDLTVVQSQVFMLVDETMVILTSTHPDGAPDDHIDQLQTMRQTFQWEG